MRHKLLFYQFEQNDNLKSGQTYKGVTFKCGIDRSFYGKLMLGKIIVTSNSKEPRRGFLRSFL